MNRLAVIGSIVCCALAAAACGSDSTAPKPDTFSGNWQGLFYNSGASVTVNVNTTQSGSAITGSGTAVEGSNNGAVTVFGTSTPPNITVAVVLPGGSPGDTLTLIGTYITPDSVFGKVIEGGDSVAIGGLKKQ
jgi:hypothetical protein